MKIKSLLGAGAFCLLSLTSLATTYVVDSGSDVLAPTTLRFAVDNSVAGDTITFHPSTDTMFIGLGELTIDNDLVIIGNGSTVIHADIVTRLGTISGGVKLILHDLEIEGFNASGGGGGVFDAFGKLEMHNVIMHDNQCATSGACVVVNDTCLLYNCQFLNNTAGDLAGAIFCSSGPGYEFLADSCLFADNTSSNWGGAIVSEQGGGTFTAVHCVFDNNASTGSKAGAIDINGGAVHLIDSCEFFNNHADFNAGGAIFLNTNATDVTINESRLHHNTATNGAAVGMASGILTITNSQIDSNSTSNVGGAIHLVSSGNILNCVFTTFLGNQGTIGGAVYTTAGGTATMDQCTFYQNSAPGNGGAIYSQNMNWGFNSCTFSENNVSSGNGGAVYCFGASGTYNFNSCTIAHNSVSNLGGGIYTGSTTTHVYLENTIVAENIAGSNGDDLYATSIGFQSNDHNFIGNATMGVAPTWGANDITGSGTGSICPKLAPIDTTDAGILAYELLPCSPCIDAGSFAATMPQQLVNRDPSPDIGSTEFFGGIAATSFTVTSLADVGVGTLRAGICGSCADTIFFDPSTNGTPVQLESQITIDRNLVIIGNGNLNTHIDGGGSADRAFENPSWDVSVIGLRIQDFDITVPMLQGGAFYNGGNLTIDTCIFDNIHAYGGGAIYSAPGSALTMKRTMVSGALASSFPGGAILYESTGGLIVDSCEFVNCVATSSGGAISASFSFGTLSVQNSVFQDNSANNAGGALAITHPSGSVVAINDNHFFGNHADNVNSTGGAVYFAGGAEKQVFGCEFNDNRAGDGASIYADSGRVQIIQTFFHHNSASNAGGDIYLVNHPIADTSEIINSTFFSDTCAAGGAIYADSINLFLISNTFSDNQAAVGAAVTQTGGGWMFVQNNTVFDNFSASSGSLYADGAAMELSGNIIAGNVGSQDIGNNGPISSLGHNVIGDGVTTGVGISWLASDTTGTAAAPVDARLEPPAFNGGLNLITFLPGCLSPAIDRGGTAPATDQIGNPRLGAPDAGSMELQFAHSLPVATLAGNLVGCGTGTYPGSLGVDLTGTAPFSVTYNTGSEIITETTSVSPLLISPEHAGIYTLIDVADADCPTGSVSGVGMVSDSILNISVNLDVLPDCDSTNGVVSANIISGGTGSYTYEWSNGDITATADTVGAGYHIVLVEDLTTGCKETGVALLNNPTGPAISFASVTPVSCPGSADGAIDATISGIAPLDIQWTNGFTTEDVSGVIGGHHVVEVVDANGCKNLDSVLVFEADPIEISFTQFNPNCGVVDGGLQANVTGGTGGYTYSWSSGGMAALEAPLGFGTYVVVVTDGNGCSSADSTILNEVGAPTMQIDSITLPDCGLANGSIYITGSSSGTVTYDWDGLAVEDLINATAGMHILTLTDGSCSSGFMVDLPSLAPVTTQLCLATVDSATEANVIVWEEVAGIGISHYEIYRKALFGTDNYYKVGTVPVDSLSFFIDTVANTDAIWWNYKIKTVDSCGSASPLSEAVNHKTIHLSLYPASTPGSVKLKWNHYQGFSFSQYYIDRYTTATGWVTIDSVASTITQFTTALPADTLGLMYQIFAKSPSTCSPTKAIGDFNSSRSNRKSEVTGAAPSALEEEAMLINVFPNPVSDLLTLRALHNQDILTIKVLDNIGRQVAYYDVSGNGGVLDFKLSTVDLASGNYMLALSSSTGTYHYKFIKQ